MRITVFSGLMNDLTISTTLSPKVWSTAWTMPMPKIRQWFSSLNVNTQYYSPGRSTKSRLGDSGSIISTRTLFFENWSRSGSTSVLSSCSLFLRKSVSDRWGLKTAAWARLIHISTSDLVYILLPKGSTVRLPSSSIWRLMEHDQTPVVLLIMHSMGHL